MPTSKNNKDDKVLGGAAMAPHPFTTIDANIGYCYVPVFGSCPEDEIEGREFLNNIGISIGSCHGRVEGKRLLPVKLKDVAGLVPGAYEGRGKGNKFLDDLTDADVLIHVVDASGKADAEGNQVCESINNPINDLEWIRNEIVAWVRARMLSIDVNRVFATKRLFFSFYFRCTAM
jgi:ribosome-binding ATPase YchF (GTP1/OBG family)